MHTLRNEKLLILVVLITKCFKPSCCSGTTPCGHSELVQCSKRLKPITDSGFNFINTKEELDNICPDLHAGLECIRSYTRRCMDLREREHYRKIYAGTDELIGDLCMEGSFQEDFLRHVPCMKKVKSEYEICAVNYQSIMTRINQQRAEQELKAMAATTTMSPVTSTLSNKSSKQFSVTIKIVKRQHESKENSSSMVTRNSSSHHQNSSSTSSSSDNGNEQIKTVCCAFQEYMKCSELAVKEGCGSETAEFTRNFLDKMLSSLMRMHCQEPEKLQCEGYSSDNSAIIHHNCCVIVFFVIFILFMIL